MRPLQFLHERPAALCEPGNAANQAARLLTGRPPFQASDGAPLNQHLGLGGVGLSAVMGARMVGATAIGAVDVVADPRDIAAQVIEETGGGVHYAFDATGAAAVVSQAYAAERRGGTTVIVRLPDPWSRIPVSPADLVATERTLRGSYMGSAVPARDRIVGERLEPNDVPSAFERLHRGSVVGRQLVTIGEAA